MTRLVYIFSLTAVFFAGLQACASMDRSSASTGGPDAQETQETYRPHGADMHGKH